MGLRLAPCVPIEVLHGNRDHHAVYVLRSVSVRLDPRAFRHAPSRLSNPLEPAAILRFGRRGRREAVSMNAKGFSVDVRA